jgi:hypothetical protein
LKSKIIKKKLISFFKIKRMMIGDSEIIQPINNHTKLNRPSRIVKYYGFMTMILNNLFNTFNKRRPNSHSTFIGFLKSLEKKLENFLGSLSKTYNYKHRMCTHRYNCFIYPIVVSLVDLYHS